MSRKVVTVLITSALFISNFSNLAYAESTTVTEAGGRAEAVISLDLNPTSSPGTGGGSTDPTPTPITDPTPTPDLFSATVPKVLPAAIDTTQGSVVVADNIQIINNVENKGIKVTAVDVTTASNWSITDYDADFTAIADNTPTIGVSLRSDKVSTDGSVALTDEYWSIAKNTAIDVDMKLKVPKITESVENSDKIATVGFTLDWSGDDTSTENADPPSDSSGNTGGGESGGTYSVNFSVRGNGYLIDANGDEVTTLSLDTDQSGTLVYPSVKAATLAYEFDGWYNADTNEEITDLSATIPEGTDIVAVFVQKGYSSSNWFIVNSDGELTGLSDEYVNMANAPTELVVPKQVGGVLVKTIGTAFAQRDAIESIVLPECVTSIVDNAFESCTSLTSLLVPSTVTSIGGAAFKGCSNLCDVDFVSSVTSISDSAFENCTSLKKISSSSVTSIGTSAFKGCTNLKSIDFPALSTISSSAFQGSGLESISATGVTTIGSNVFYECSALKSVDLPNVTSVGQAAFYNDTNIETVNLSELTSIGSNAFYNCNNLASTISVANSVTDVPSNTFKSTSSDLTIKLDKYTNELPNLPWGADNASIVWSRGDATGAEPECFSISNGSLTGLTYLGKQQKDLIIPATVTTIKENSIQSSKVENITIPASVTTINILNTSRIDSLKSITYEGDNSTYTCDGKALYNSKELLAYANNCGATELTVPEGITNLHYLLRYVSDLKTINLPSSLIKLGSTEFESCTDLTVNTPNCWWDVSTDGLGGGATNVTVNYAEIPWVMLTDADFSGTTDGSFKYIGSGKQYVVIPNTINGVAVTNLRSLFKDNYADIKGVKIDNPNLTDISSMFEYCTGLKSLYMDINTSQIPDKGLKCYYTLLGCQSLSKVYLAGFDFARVAEDSVYDEGFASGMGSGVSSTLIYLDKKDESAFKSTYNWSKYGTKKYVYVTE